MDENKIWRLRDERQRQGEHHKEVYQANSRKRLHTITEKKLKTSFIGALSEFEQAFGHMWGHGKPMEELTEEERAMREKWNETRTNILNNGNNQLRALLSEISEYTISWNRKVFQPVIKD